VVFGKRISFLFLILAISSASTETRADDPSGDSEIGIINLSDQDFSAELRECLNHRKLAECLAEEMKSSSKKQKPSVEKQIASPIDSDLAHAWKDFLYNSITPFQSLWNNAGGLATYFGLQIAANRIEPDEVIEDPNKFATEKKLNDNGVWVKHEFELIPQLAYGYKPDRFASTTSYDGSYGGLFTVNAVMRIVKRHPMDNVYNDSFWGIVGQELKIVEQAFPMYFTIGSHLNGEGLLPGEGVEFERYGALSIGLGPTANLVGTPVTNSLAGAGVFASAGLVLTLVRGHFRTVMEAQEDGTLRLSLMHIDQDSEKLEAQLGAGAYLGPLSYVLSLAKIEAGVIHTQQKVLDMVFDPKYPEALSALHAAYFGYFGPSQTLAAAANTHYRGVREIDITQKIETEHEHDLQLLTYERGESNSEEKISTQANGPGVISSEITEDSLVDHRSTSRSQKSLEVDIDTDDKNSDPSTNRELSAKLVMSTTNAKPEELKQLLDLARSFAPAQTQETVATWLKTLETDHPKDKRGSLQGYFYICFDPATLFSLLQNSDSQLLVNWAQALALPDPESWRTMSGEEQDSIAGKTAGLSDHLKAFRNFTKAVASAMKKKTAVGQAQILVKSLKGMDFDLYPILALATSSDHSHLVALERITLGVGGVAQSLNYSSIGSNFVITKQAMN
jgi:hypothetical protein